MERKGDERWMRKALALARRGEGRTRPNPPVGAVLVRGGRCVGQGFHRLAGGPHAEIHALNQAGAHARGATLYVTLEPCSTQGRTGPCTAAILRAGVSRVVIATRDPNPRHDGRGVRTLRRGGVQVAEGICEEDGRELIRPFARCMRTGRPFLTLKAGMTLDGRIADPRGRSRWITGEEARATVRRMRARADAVMVGGRTAWVDDPSLLCGTGRGQAYRVIVDSSGRLPLKARVLTDGFASRTIVATTSRCPRSKAEGYASGGATVWRLPSANGRVSAKHLMRRLGRLGLLHVLCEGGGELAASLVRQGLVDEYVFFIAPRFLGGGAVPVIGGTGWPLGRTPRLIFTDCRRIGSDLMIRAVSAGEKVNG